METYRGLTSRLCTICAKLVPHRTIYVKIESANRTTWFQVYRLCMGCRSLNPIIYNKYTLKFVPSSSASALARVTVDALTGGPLDSATLLVELRRRRVSDSRHIFKSDVAMALEYLARQGVVSVDKTNRTNQVLNMLRLRNSMSKHLGACPAEKRRGIETKSLISLYVQRRGGIETGDASTFVRSRLLRAGVLCVRCGYYRVDRNSVERSIEG